VAGIGNRNMTIGFIFDMDGLLIDSERIYQQSRSLAPIEFGFEIEPEYYYASLAGKHLGDCNEIICQKAGFDIEMVSFQARCMALVSELTGSVGFDCKRGAVDLLKFAVSVGPCAVASGSNRDHVERSLAQTGLIDYFNHIVARDDVSKGKPSPELFLEASKRLGISASNCIVFEDSNDGVKAANLAVMDVVMVPDIQQPNTESRSTALAVVEELGQAIPIVLTKIRPLSVE